MPPPKRTPLADDVPWRALPPGEAPVPKIHRSPILRLPQTSTTQYALAVMKMPDPVGSGFAMEARLESAGPDCLVPGQVTPVKVLGVKIWPININLKFMEPIERQLQSIGKFLDSAVNLMNSSFQDR